MVILSWIVRVVAAIILLQTLYFKFTGAPESVYIFSTLGAEPVGRIGSGVIELIAAILLLIPSTAGWGAILAMGVMTGALVAHFAKLGVEIQGDGGQLFYLGIAVFVCSAIALVLHWRQSPLALVIKNG